MASSDFVDRMVSTIETGSAGNKLLILQFIDDLGIDLLALTAGGAIVILLLIKCCMSMMMKNKKE